MSAVLHALVGMTANEGPPPAPSAEDDEEGSLPVTSYLCQWKVPKRRKESSLQMADVVFTKHDYHKQKKQKVKLVTDYDPRPPEYCGTAHTLLPALLDRVRGESLGVSVMFDTHYAQKDVVAPSPDVPSVGALRTTIEAFKESLKMQPEKIQQIEQSTREQRNSPLWFEVRRYRLTASRFGEVLKRRQETPPDRLVLDILQPRSFHSVAIDWGIKNEPLAIQEYMSWCRYRGKHEVVVEPSGFYISETHPFLGASPDGIVYDPANMNEPFGFIEIKCPYSQRSVTPEEACSSPGFCSTLKKDPIHGSVLSLRRDHKYFAQVQGQMAVGNRPWCDFVIFTEKGISVERIPFSRTYWELTLFPKLEKFFDNCLGPEIVSPMHALGLPLRDLSK